MVKPKLFELRDSTSEGGFEVDINSNESRVKAVVVTFFLVELGCYAC